MRIKLLGALIFKEKAGVVSEGPIWICFEREFMYMAPTLLGLIWQVITEWRNERYMVG